MIEDLLATCSAPHHLPIFFSRVDNSPLVFVNATRSTTEWASIRVELGQDAFDIGWNGKRLSWTDDTKALYRHYRQFHHGLFIALKGMSPTDVVLQALEIYHDDMDVPVSPRPEPLHPDSPNTVVDISVMARPYPLFARVRSVHTTQIELVTLVPGQKKRWARRTFYKREHGPQPPIPLDGGSEPQLSLLKSFRHQITMTDLRAVTIGAAWTDLRTIADQPHG
ncbi:hypothetical protein [uncultured Tateyamaria sp.]|uniref:hypothetical protein n=1 Tax=uncultured Tateyamaria sp. TaxID=455651 RepID=UPI0026382EB2|nr:hypothetical protein [uncultured Tateyamaria sp.]